MDPRLLEYLRQIGNAAQQSIQFVDGMSYPEFEKDTRTQRAVTMNLVILGASAAKLEEHFPDFVVAHPRNCLDSYSGHEKSNCPRVLHPELRDDLDDNQKGSCHN